MYNLYSFKPLYILWYPPQRSTFFRWILREGITISLNYKTKKMYIYIYTEVKPQWIPTNLKMYLKKISDKNRLQTFANARGAGFKIQDFKKVLESKCCILNLKSSPLDSRTFWKSWILNPGGLDSRTFLNLESWILNPAPPGVCKRFVSHIFSKYGYHGLTSS